MSTAAITEHRDPFGAKFGMWLFLFTEMILFGGIFLLYAVYRSTFAADFHFAAGTLNRLIGGLNTLILLTSSLTMVLSIATLERGRRRASGWFLLATIVLGLAFLVIKGFEWTAKIHHGIFPGSEEVLDHTAGENIFYGLYYAMTGLHALHVIVGLAILAIMWVGLVRAPRRRRRLPIPPGGGATLSSPGGQTLWSQPPGDDAEAIEIALVYADDAADREARAVKLENAGLYWHLVDVIWIFLFPLLYLVS